MEQEVIPTLGPYRILKELSSDAWGILYEACQEGSSQATLLRAISPAVSTRENFIVRFDLLKTLLPHIRHKNLLEIYSLGCSQNIYYIAKEMPAQSSLEIQTLAQFDARDTPNRGKTLEILFQGVADALSTLEEFNKSYYKQGIIHDSLSLDQIYICFERSLIGQQSVPCPKVDGFCESFLFFGEGFSATLQAQLTPFEYLWRNQGKDLTRTSYGLFESQRSYPYHARKSLPFNSSFMQFSFGALIYQYITKTRPKGLFPPLKEFDPVLEPEWNDIFMRCLSSPYGEGYSSMAEIRKTIEEMLSRREKKAPHVKKLEELPIPEGMTLVAFTDKVVLGASDGPLIEQPRFKIKVKPFFIDLHPVTCAQFNQFQKLYQRSSYSSKDEHPATLVTWHMAQAYCEWRNEKEGLPKGTYRLPTEYEWEAAVRGGSQEQYPWGEHLDKERLHCGAEMASGTLPIKSFPPGRFGIYDLLGSVWEWTSSIFSPHPFSKHIEKGYKASLYTVKGGCWYSPTNSIRASMRAAFRPTERRGNIGFRCVRSAIEEK